MNVTRGTEDSKNTSSGDISTVCADALDGVRGNQDGSQQLGGTNHDSLVVFTPLCLTTTGSSLSADVSAFPWTRIYAPTGIFCS